MAVPVEPDARVYGARRSTTDLDVDGVEISEARWFSRDELRAAIADGSLRFPMRASVAFYLIDGWFGGGLAEIVAGSASST